MEALRLTNDIIDATPLKATAFGPYFTIYSMYSIRKRGLLRLFVRKMIVLPRQARDKHRESTVKRSGVWWFVAGSRASTICFTHLWRLR
jgi:hypothetical protein